MTRREWLKLSSCALLGLVACDPKKIFEELEAASEQADAMEAELVQRVGGDPSVTWNKTNGYETVRVAFFGGVDEASAHKAVDELAKKHFPDADRVELVRCKNTSPNVQRCEGF